MSEICLTCVKAYDSRLSSVSSIKARATLSNCINISLKSHVNIKPFTSNTVVNKSSLLSRGKLSGKTKCSFNAYSLKEKGIANIKAYTKVRNSTFAKLKSIGNISDVRVDKFAFSSNNLSNINEFGANEKLYPIKDIVTEYNGSRFVDKYLGSGNLYTNIDEGVVIGNYTKHGSSGLIISDERQAYIQPSSIFTKGDFRYKCEVNRPLSGSKKSFIFIRACAPTSDYASDVPPQYKLHNIRLEDPSGNLIIKYKDIVVRGDSNYEINENNFSTYISEQEVNNLQLHTWDPNYPYMESPSGYSLNIDFNIDCLDDPFSEGFSSGYEDTCKIDSVIGTNSGVNPNNYLAIDGSPLSTQSQGFYLNPNNSIRVSAIEIANSGSLGLIRDSYLRFYSHVNSVGQRNSRYILPRQIINNYTNINVYPQSNSVWQSSPDDSGNLYYNTSDYGSQVLASKIQNDAPNNYITLSSIDPINDSGRLTLVFSHTTPTTVSSYSDGAFGFGDKSNDFDTAELQLTSETDNFFTIDSIELKVVAKKAPNTRDYVIDVIGYSDDKLLNVTSKVNAFLQNSETGSGNIPSVSGFLTIDDLGISTESFSEKNQYFENSLINNPAGDHYKLSTAPVISGTTFQEYTIPLKIYEDYVTLGKSTDYSMSSFFEQLYLDLYAIPSGASISTAYLVIHYKPSNALHLHTLGQPQDVSVAQRDLTLYPSQQQNNNSLVNGLSSALSEISNIPQSYSSNSGVKSNYSRRWRGVDNNTYYGPYNSDQFDFGFYNPQHNDPFNIGHYDFTNYYQFNNVNYFIQNKPEDSPRAQYDLAYTGTISNLIHNYGLRFNNSSIFNSATNHTTIDWTSISGHTGSNLYGKISDSFSSLVRVGGSDQLYFVDSSGSSIDSGFALFFRFSPDIHVSGSNYNLFDSGVLAGKWSTGNELEFIVKYTNGYITAIAQDSSGNFIEIQDTIPYTDYQYPLPILITYNDKNSQRLRLYTDNELVSQFDNLRASSSQFIPRNPMVGSVISIGSSSASGVGFPCFISDVGLSVGYCNIISSGIISKHSQESYAQSLFDGLRMPYTNSSQNSRYALPLFIDENTSDWSIGDFRSTSFASDFGLLTKRSGSDFIVHSINHHGSGYNEITNIAFPSSINLDGVAYHTQIENDFLRFNLSNIEDADNSFYATSQRIHKNLPRGYSFEEKSIYAETVIEQIGDINNVWGDGSYGPKLIVSLYTKTQEPLYIQNTTNWGLVNRSVHQIQSSGGIHKLVTTFNYNDIFDISEPWANFDVNLLKTEFNHKYFSKDIDDMFLQYDLVYPSGLPFKSTIKIHSANVKLTDYIAKQRDIGNVLNFIASGEQYTTSSINLAANGLGIEYNTQNLYTLSDLAPISDSSVNLCCSGANFFYNNINVYCHNIGISDNNLPIYINGRYNQFDDQILPLITINTFKNASADSTFNLYINNKAPTFEISTLNLAITGRRELINYFPSGSVNLYVGGEPYWKQESNTFNLYIGSLNPIANLYQSMNLCSINYVASASSAGNESVLIWNGKP